MIRFRSCGIRRVNSDSQSRVLIYANRGEMSSLDFDCNRSVNPLVVIALLLGARPVEGVLQTALQATRSTELVECTIIRSSPICDQGTNMRG